MKYIILYIVGFISFAVSVFSFSQIIGSFQHAHQRGLKPTLITILIHTVIVALAAWIVVSFLYEYRIAAIIGAIIGLLFIPGRIE